MNGNSSSNLNYTIPIPITTNNNNTNSDTFNEIGSSSSRFTRPWFLNVPGNQYLVDQLKLTLIIIVPLFLAFITLLVIFPGVFKDSTRKRRDTNRSSSNNNNILTRTRRGQGSTLNNDDYDTYNFYVDKMIAVQDWIWQHEEFLLRLLN